MCCSPYSHDCVAGGPRPRSDALRSIFSTKIFCVFRLHQYWLGCSVHCPTAGLFGLSRDAHPEPSLSVTRAAVLSSARREFEFVLTKNLLERERRQTWPGNCCGKSALGCASEFSREDVARSMQRVLGGMACSARSGCEGWNGDCPLHIPFHRQPLQNIAVRNPGAVMCGWSIS